MPLAKCGGLGRDQPGCSGNRIIGRQIARESNRRVCLVVAVAALTSGVDHSRLGISRLQLPPGQPEVVLIADRTSDGLKALFQRRCLGWSANLEIQPAGVGGGFEPRRAVPPRVVVGEESVGGRHGVGRRAPSSPGNGDAAEQTQAQRAGRRRSSRVRR